MVPERKTASGPFRNGAVLPPSTMLPVWTGQAVAGTRRTCAPAAKSEPDISAVRTRVVFTSESGVISATEGTGTAPVIPITRGRRTSANTVRDDRSAGTFMELPHRKQCIKGIPSEQDSRYNKRVTGIMHFWQ